jgi:cell division GTPase FtsZ
MTNEAIKQIIEDSGLCKSEKEKIQKTLSFIIGTETTINIDYYDVITVLEFGKLLPMATGIGRNTKEAFDNIENDLSKARAIIMFVKVKPNTSLSEVSGMGERVKKRLNEKCNIIFGVDLQDRRNVEISIVAVK